MTLASGTEVPGAAVAVQAADRITVMTLTLTRGPIRAAAVAVAEAVAGAEGTDPRTLAATAGRSQGRLRQQSGAGDHFGGGPWLWRRALDRLVRLRLDGSVGVHGSILRRDRESRVKPALSANLQQNPGRGILEAKCP